MKITLLPKVTGAIAAAMLLSIAVPKVQAGEPHTYIPVKTVQQADAIKPGQKIAVHCACGAITLLTVNKDRSNLSDFVCPVCHHEFRVSQVGTSGKSHASGMFVLTDKEGNEAHVAVME